MTQLLRVFKKFTNKIFGIKESELSSIVSFESITKEAVILKTRTQLIEEGKSAYLPKRHRQPLPVVSKLN